MQDGLFNKLYYRVINGKRNNKSLITGKLCLRQPQYFKVLNEIQNYENVHKMINGSVRLIINMSIQLKRQNNPIISILENEIIRIQQNNGIDNNEVKLLKELISDFKEMAVKIQNLSNENEAVLTRADVLMKTVLEKDRINY